MPLLVQPHIALLPPHRNLGLVETQSSLAQAYGRQTAIRRKAHCTTMAQTRAMTRRNAVAQHRVYPKAQPVFAPLQRQERTTILENNQYIHHCFCVIFFDFHEISSFLLTAKTLTPKVFLRRDFPDVTMLHSSNA
ncbi:hypothetical protein [Achromobacter aegrifaciens]